MPILLTGRQPARMTYGMARVLAHAIPTPVIDSSSSHLSWIIATESSPDAPHSKQSECVVLRPNRAASHGRISEKTKQTTEYIAKHRPAHSTPSVYMRDVSLSAPNTLCATATGK